MGLFDVFKKKNIKITIDALKNEDYSQIYFEECKFIWKNYVPRNGKSEVLQGELLRILEKLRFEAQDNGNINWNDDYTMECDYLRDRLCDMEIFTSDEKAEIKIIMDFIKDCGTYAQRFNEGEIEEVDIEKLAYTNDNLYDRIADKIGFFHANGDCTK